METIKGKVWLFGDNIDTDAITPGAYLDSPVNEMVKHVMESVRPDFTKAFNKGDIIVAGSNFGCGSSRESAPGILKTLGIGAIVAQSFARIFFRNAIALGIPIVILESCPRGFSDGDSIEVHFEDASVVNLSTGTTMQGTKLYDVIVQTILKGGL